MKALLQSTRTFKILLLLFAIFLVEPAVNAQNDRIPEIKRYAFSKGYESSVGIENAGDNRLFVIERGGKIWIATIRGKKKAVPLLGYLW